MEHFGEHGLLTILLAFEISDKAVVSLGIVFIDTRTLGRANRNIGMHGETGYRGDCQTERQQPCTGAFGQIEAKRNDQPDREQRKILGNVNHHPEKDDTRNPDA